MKRYLSLILLAASCAQSPPPTKPQPVAKDTSADDKAAAQAQADADRAAAEVARADETARAEGVIITRETKNPPACCTTFVKSSPIGKYGQVQVWKGTADQITKYVVVFGSGDTWRLAEPLDYIEGGDCGMGHCVDRKLQTLVVVNNTITDHGAAVREGFDVVFMVTEDHYANESQAKHDVSSHEVKVDCTFGPTPTCTDGRFPQR